VKKYMQKKQGFTLIELLVVIAIIGILSAIGLTALSGAQSKARDVKRKADLGALNASLTLYTDNNGAYPIQATPLALWTMVGTVETLAASAAGNIVAASTAATNGFAIPKAPTPLGTTAGAVGVNSYWYITDATGSKFALFSALENGTNQWFVSNSKGYSDVVTGSAAPVTPTATVTECADSKGASPIVQSVCLSQPVM
jgi:prepilin-type N-terminal cleavage/methylation domain-containing protein